MDEINYSADYGNEGVHVIAGLAPGVFRVLRDGIESGIFEVEENGFLKFIVSGGGDFKIVIQ
ncbi:MAG: hypothetical protein GWN00_19240 [Aliifodinibius sp.]|nr:hypothetical protein [Fodinibius sp.]NIV13196.1 hypothetical protein [Fodinibius sp.]NIY26861.1 hypothetical protein [Fodinibius sp.]